MSKPWNQGWFTDELRRVMKEYKPRRWRKATNRMPQVLREELVRQADTLTRQREPENTTQFYLTPPTHGIWQVHDNAVYPVNGAPYFAWVGHHAPLYVETPVEPTEMQGFDEALADFT